MATTIQRSGSHGEIGPDFYSRADLAPYHSAFRTLRNFYVKKQGSVENRGGLAFIAEAINPAQTYRQIRFKYSNTDAFWLIFGNQTLNFIKNGQYIYDYSVPYAGRAGNNPVVASATTPLGTTLFKPGDIVTITGVPGIANKFFKLGVVTPGNPSTIQLLNTDGSPTVGTNWVNTGVTATSMINRVYTLATPYLSADLAVIKAAESFNLLELRHPSYSPLELIRNTDISWNLSVKNYWPKVFPSSSELAVIGGQAGPLSIKYKVTTYNLDTKEESFPGIIGSAFNSVTNPFTVAQWNVNTVIITSPAHGLINGTQIVFSQDFHGFQFNPNFPFSPPVFFPLVVSAGSICVITVLDANTFSFPVFVTNFQAQQVLSPASGTYTTISTIAKTKIVSISNTNPINLKVIGHGLVSSDEVFIQNTGVYGLDKVIFTITKIDNDNYTLNGADGANYNVAAYLGVGGLASGTTATLVGAVPTTANPTTLTWKINAGGLDPSKNRFLFLVYSSINNVFGFIGTLVPTKIGDQMTFVDSGIRPTEARTPPIYTPIFIGTDNYPSVPAFFDQRLMELSTNKRQQGLFGSATGLIDNFSTHNPLLASDAIISDISSTELSIFLDAVDMGFLILLSDIGPFVLAGANGGGISPLDISAKTQAFLGAAQNPRPLKVQKNVIYLLADGSTVQDLQVLQTLWGSYIGETDDISLLSSHLLDGFTLLAWDFQQFPHPIIWAIRNDGAILSLTYDFKNKINGWARHDTINGAGVDVVTIQQKTQSIAQFQVKRTIGGAKKVYFEQLVNHNQTDIRDYNFLDCSLKYDGRTWTGANFNFNLTNAGGDWSDQDAGIKATASQPCFTAGMVGQALQMVNAVDAQGNPLTLTITSFTSATVVGVSASAAIPVSEQGTPLTGAVLAVPTVYGLWPLEGQAVSVFADGYEVANALTDANPLVVANGSLTLDMPYGVITVGLPITADIETLNPDDPQGETLVDKKKLANKVNIGVSKTRGCYLGAEFPGTDDLDPDDDDFNRSATDPVANMVLLNIKEVEDGYYTPTQLATGFVQEIIQGEWNFKGRVCLRNVSPGPVTITSIAPSYIED